MKRMLVISTAAAFFVAAFTINVMAAESSVPKKAISSHSVNEAAAASRVQRGLQIAPVPLNLQGKNRALVGLGSYLVNAVSECNDCHSCPTYEPGHNPFDGIGDGQLNSANHLAGGVNFGPGPDGDDIVSANITPDESGRPHGLTFEEFVEIIRTGHEEEDEKRFCRSCRGRFSAT